MLAQFFWWQSAGIERSIVLPGTLAVPDEPDSPNRDSSKASSTVRRFVTWCLAFYENYRVTCYIHWIWIIPWPYFQSICSRSTKKEHQLRFLFLCIRWNAKTANHLTNIPGPGTSYQWSLAGPSTLQSLQPPEWLLGASKWVLWPKCVKYHEVITWSPWGTI